MLAVQLTEAPPTWEKRYVQIMDFESVEEIVYITLSPENSETIEQSTKLCKCCYMSPRRHRSQLADFI